MDNRLVRGLNAAEKEALLVWYRESKTHLQHLAKVLGEEAEATRAQDDTAEFFEKAEPITRLAHSAGYRQGLSAAVRLLIPKGH